MTDARGIVRLGLIGCGRAVLTHHAPALRRVPQIRVTAVADVDAGRLQEVAEYLGVPERYAGADELLAGARVDAVAVMTPTRTHAEIGGAVLRSGRHLFVEKPLAHDVAACGRLEAAMLGAPGCALVGHNARWHRLVEDARAFITRGQLGPVKAIRSAYTHWHPDSSGREWHRYRSEGGGVLINDGVHHFDLWRHLLGDEVVEVGARSRSSSTYEDDTCVVDAQLAGGALASAVLSFSSAPSSDIDIYGELGRLSLSMYRFDGLRFLPHSTYDGSPGWRVRQAAHSLGSVARMIATAGRGGEFDRTYAAMWRHFAECALGRATPACTLADGRAAVDIALAAVESAACGRPVAVRPAREQASR